MGFERFESIRSVLFVCVCYINHGVNTPSGQGVGTQAEPVGVGVEAKGGARGGGWGKGGRGHR